MVEHCVALRSVKSNPDTATAPQPLSLAEVARRLGVNEKTVYGLIDNGELAIVQGYGVSPSRKVLESDLADFIRRRTEGENAG
jgi:excisionase family DNA binding protein